MKKSRFGKFVAMAALIWKAILINEEKKEKLYHNNFGLVADLFEMGTIGGQLALLPFIGIPR